MLNNLELICILKKHCSEESTRNTVEFSFAAVQWHSVKEHSLFPGAVRTLLAHKGVKSVYQLIDADGKVL